MASRRGLVCCCVSLALIVVVESVTVPVLMWSNRDLKGIEPRWSGLKDVGEAFSSDVVKHETDTVVIFLQGRLSFSVIAQYGGVYGEDPAVLAKMKDLSEQLSFLTVESSAYVENPAMDALAENGFDVLRETPGKCDQLKKRAFIVDLPEEIITKDALKAGDLAVSQTVSLLRTCGMSFTVVYTTSTPVLDAHPHIIRRSLSQFDFGDNSSNETSSELFFVVDSESKSETCLMLYLTTLTYFEVNGTSITNHAWTSTATNETVTPVSGACMINESCGQENSTFPSLSLSINRTSNGSVTDKVDVIEFIFPCDSSGYWNISVNLAVDGKPPVSLPMVRQDGIGLFIPQDVSYHCSTRLMWTNLYTDKHNSSNTTYGVFITGLQVQAYKGIPSSGNSSNTTKYEFTTVYDCQPYVSEAVWMGMVCLLPLFLMLYCSMAFLFQMETMDKFDDPRGRTISVASGR